MNKKLVKQIAIIAGVVGTFAVANAFVFAVFTNRVINYSSSQMQAKSVEVDKFLPFAKETKIVKKENADKL